MAPPPGLGALGVTFTAMRIFQAISLLTIIGLSGNFVAELVASSFTTPSALIGTLVVVSHEYTSVFLFCFLGTVNANTSVFQSCFAMVYIIITYILYWDQMLPLLIATAADGLCFIASIVVACVVGKPVSYLTCEAFPKKGNTGNFVHSLFNNVKKVNSNKFEWVDPSRKSCLEIKAIWGLSIATSILFFMSAIAAVCLWKRIKGSSDRRPKSMDFE